MGKSVRDVLHIALVLIVFGGLYSIFCKQKYAMETGYEGPAMMRGFPYALTLEEFSIDKYDSGADRNYTSRLNARSLSGEDTTIVTSVNAPARLGGWRIYQMGYDTQAGENSSYSVLQCVRDPLFPVIAIGLWMMIAGSLLLIVVSVPGGGRKWLWIASAALFFIFLYLTMKRVGLGATDLRPALRSGWFIPHIVVYMFGYAILTALTVYAVILSFRSGSHPITNRQMNLCNTLSRIGWGFLSMGMCMGALWAKQSWGDWWTWDPKETWALITWTSYLTFFHISHRIKKGWAIAILIVSFLFLQMCWWGVNLLPSAGSLHTY
ncbi:MAG: cytochrome c biogenesis protein CcsA [Bacteroidales bacterium]|nr:cytochrome c biogenesis protein CcsA [Bacteroidales bacterium]